MDAETLARLETSAELRRRRFSPARLKAARQARQLTQQASADALGLFIRHYQKIEAGDLRPNSDLLGAIADTMDVTIDSLFAMPDEEASA